MACRLYIQIGRCSFVACIRSTCKQSKRHPELARLLSAAAFHMHDQERYFTERSNILRCCLFQTTHHTSFLSNILLPLTLYSDEPNLLYRSYTRDTYLSRLFFSPNRTAREANKAALNH